MKLNLTIATLIMGICLSSCYQRMYFPDRVNSPGLKEAMEAKLTLAVKPQQGMDTNGNFSGLSPSGDIAFSPLNHLGIIGSYRSVNNKFISENGHLFNAGFHQLNDGNRLGGTYNGNSWEIGAGYYTDFYKHGIFEAYAGYGHGKIERYGLNYHNYDFNSRYHRFFLQSAAGLDYDNISFTAGVRFAINKYTTFNSSDSSLRYIITLDNDGHTDVLGQGFGLLEPFVNFEVGYKYIKFNFQAGGSKPFLSNSVSGRFPIYATFGLAFHFAPRYFADKSNNREK